MTLATTQKTISNAALRHLGERKIVDVNGTDENAIILREIWENDNFVDDCLSHGQWSFATRTSEIGYDPDIETTFGFTYVFEKPTDLVRLTGMYNDPRLTMPLLGYVDGPGIWTAYVQTIYVTYVSNDPSYFGGVLTSWPSTMVRWAECYLAWRACFRITQNKDLEDKLWKKQQKLLIEAKSFNAQQGPTKFAPIGSWANSRLGGWGSNSGGGNWT